MGIERRVDGWEDGLRKQRTGPRCQVSDAPLFDDPSIGHHGRMIADLADNVHFVGDQQDGQAQAAVQVAQQLEDGGGILRVERRGGLIG
jgi:hypothetical protein